MPDNSKHSVQPEIDEDYLRIFVHQLFFESDPVEQPEQDEDLCRQNEERSDTYRRRLDSVVVQVSHCACRHMNEYQ